VDEKTACMDCGGPVEGWMLRYGGGGYYVCHICDRKRQEHYCRCVMGDLTKNFSRWEFACNCGCGFDRIDMELVENLQSIRDQFTMPIHVSSGCRCAEYNNSIGSKPTSQHVLGKAADIWIADVRPIYIARRAVKLACFKYGGIGVYDTFVHLDVRGKTARWGRKWR